MLIHYIESGFQTIHEDFYPVYYYTALKTSFQCGNSPVNESIDPNDRQ